MKSKEYDKLNDYEVQSKVAELLGWTELCTAKDSKHSENFQYFGCSPDALTGSTPSGTPIMRVPDYPNDLNACHGFEVELKDSQLLTMFAFLQKITGLRTGVSPCLIAFKATAAQRCKAFVLMMTEGDES